MVDQDEQPVKSVKRAWLVGSGDLIQLRLFKPSLPACRELDLRGLQAAPSHAEDPRILNQSRGIDRIKTEATPKQSAAAKVIVNKGSQA